MNRIISISLLLIIAFQSFSALLVEGVFYLNQDEIAEAKCELKDLDITQCNGVCVLEDVLAASEEQKEQDREISHKTLLFCTDIEEYIPKLNRYIIEPTPHEVSIVLSTFQAIITPPPKLA